MKQLVFATQNQNKAKELQQLVGERFELLSLKDLHCDDDIEETGNTLRENAALKAEYVFAKFNRSCFADDTGLEVETLQGAPGVYSARYAGPQKNDQDNIALLLKNLAGETNRRARFVTMICLISEGKEYFFEGELRGEIIAEPRGGNGFGYDPVFVPEGYSKTLAELSLEEKNSISHRAKAFAALTKFLKQQD